MVSPILLHWLDVSYKSRRARPYHHPVRRGCAEPILKESVATGVRHLLHRGTFMAGVCRLYQQSGSDGVEHNRYYYWDVPTDGHHQVQRWSGRR